MKKHGSILLAGMLLASAGLTAQIYDGFSSSVYTVDETVNQLGGGSGWANDWNVNLSGSANNFLRYQGSSNSLGYTDSMGNSLYTTPGSLALRAGGAGAGELSRNFTSPLTGEVWVSFLNIRTAAGAWNWEYTFASDGGTSFRIQNNSNTGFFRLEHSGATSNTNLTNYDLSADPEAQLFVLRITNVGSGSADSQISLWINPTDITDINAGAASTAVLNNRQINDIQGFVFNKGAGVDQTGYFDELRFGASSADVLPIPEPSTYAMLTGIFAFIAIALRRFRRK